MRCEYWVRQGYMAFVQVEKNNQFLASDIPLVPLILHTKAKNSNYELVLFEQKLFQPLHVLDDAGHLEIKFVHVWREVLAAPEPVLVVLHTKMDVWLGTDEFAEFGIGKEPAQFGLVIALDDEMLVKLRFAHGHVLHPQPFADVAENAAPVDGELEAVRVNIRRAHPGVGDGGFAGGDGVGIQRDDPLAMRGVHFAAAFPKTALGHIAANRGGHLLPDFVAAGSEEIAENAHNLGGDCSHCAGWSSMIIGWKKWSRRSCAWNR